MMLENLKNNKGVIKLILMLLMVTFFMMISQISYAAASDMITEWTIPRDNTTIKLPVQGTGLNITVDWGDGTDTENVITSFPTHIYEKAGIYEITVSGTCQTWGYSNDYFLSTSSDYYTYTKYLTKVKQFGELSAISYGFSKCKSLTEVSGENLVTSKAFEKVTDMSCMFYNCSNLTNLDVSGFNTSKVTNMEAMFSDCRNLTNLDVSGFDTSKVTNMAVMFSYCSNLTNLDVNNFNTSNVTKMGSVFSGCSQLTSLNISKFNTSKVTDMSYMFFNCSNLVAINVSNFDTSNTTSIYGMFYNCSKLTDLDISNFDTSNVYDTSSMFNGCTSLKTLQLSNKFKIHTSNTTNMFTNTTNLKSIILVDSTPLAGQFTNIKAQLDGKTFYVPSKVAETAYETSWSGDFSADRIKPMLELVGNESATISKGEAYVDAGYTVAGLPIADAQYYNCYGYSVTRMGSTSPSSLGTNTIRYELKRTENEVATTLMSVTRTIEIIDIDIIPPEGVISIINGTTQNGVTTVKNANIKIGVTATDNVSTAEQIKIYVVLDQVPDTKKIPDSSWENYSDGYTKTLTAPTGARNAIVYVVLKDAMGNTNTIFKDTNTSYKLKYNANGGTQAPAEETAYFGMPYKVTLKRPTYEGKYFLGWSTNKNATVASYLQNDTIPANIFAGTSSDVTLYAIWTDSIEKLPLLTDRAKVGDYINYPVSYENKGFDYYTNNSKLVGWRVISKDIDINGTPSEGTINIITAGIPMAENWHITSKDFLFDDFINGNKYHGCGFINKNLNSIFFNKYTVINNNIPAVRSVNLTDIENITGISGIALNTSLTDEKYNNLLNVGSLYELATRYSTNALYNVTDAGLLSQGQAQAGVRPVVELKNVVRTDGMDETGAWSIKIAASEEIPDQIQITFDPVGGTVTPITKLASYLGTYGELPVPTKDKYEFVGWYTERDYLTKVSETTTVDSPYNITLYAKWIPLGSFIKLTTSTLTTGNEYIITYNGAVALMEGEVSSKVSVFSGEVTPENDVIYTNDERMIWVYEKASSSNGGYFTNKHTNDQLILGGADVYGATKGNVLIYSNNTLKTPPTSNIYNPTSTYLIYSNDRFGSRSSGTVPQGSSPIYLYEQKNQVMFEPNGGTVTPTAKDITKGSAYGELPTPTKDGYIFVGWFTDDNPAEEIKSTTIVSKTGSHTLYAHWATAGTKYTITYNANGGNGAPAAQTKELNESITISSVTPTRTNYIFMGWNTKKDGSGKTYNAGETYSTNADLTLYAHWQGKAVTVTLDGNGGRYVKQNGDYAQTNTITVTYGNAYGNALTASTWYKTDYDFVGWYTSPTGGSKVSAYTAVSNANDHTLYAHWKASESGGGGTGGGTGGGSTSCTGSFVVTSDTHVSCPWCGSYSSDSDVHLITETCNKCGASTTYYSGICTCSGFKTTSPSRIHKY